LACRCAAAWQAGLPLGPQPAQLLLAADSFLGRGSVELPSLVLTVTDQMGRAFAGSRYLRVAASCWACSDWNAFSNAACRAVGAVRRVRDESGFVLGDKGAAARGGCASAGVGPGVGAPHPPRQGCGPCSWRS
jgi:hypothetical protein